MAYAKLTLIGLYNHNPHLFNGLTFPEGIDGDTAIANLLLKYGECGCIYTSSEFMQSAIEYWGKAVAPTLDRIAQTLSEEYNPLHNYDRSELSTDNSERNRTTSTDGTTTNSETTNSGNSSTGETENTVSAFNASTYQPDSKQTSNVTGTGNVQSNSAGTVDTNFTEDETGKNTRTSRIFGNIGVTTSAKLLSEEVDTRREYNFYDIFAVMFREEFLLYLF